MNEQLVLKFRVYYKLVNLIAFKLFLLYYEEVVCIDVPLPYVDVPDTNMTSRISNKQTTMRSEHHAVWMNKV